MPYSGSKQRQSRPSDKNKMTTEKDIASAISRSISHTEIVRVEVEWPADRSDSSAEEIILDWLDDIDGVVDADCRQENDGSYDVWGTRNGSDWRIRVATAQ